MARLLVCLVCALTVQFVYSGSCNGRGEYAGSGVFSGVGLFMSEAGTFEGTGTFVGNQDASFEGSASCVFTARVTSVDEAGIVVVGDGRVRGRGVFEVRRVHHLTR